MRRVVATAVAVLLGAGMLTGAVATSASATSAHDGELYISATDTTMTAGCRDYVVSYQAKALAAQTWSLTIAMNNLSNSSGFGSQFVSGTGPTTGKTTVFLCGNVDGAGVYDVQGTLDVDPLYDDMLTQIDPGGTFQATAYVLMMVNTETHGVMTHKAFSHKYASKAHPHTYKLQGYVQYFDGYLIDKSAKSIVIEYKKSGTSTYKPIARVSINDSTAVFTVKVKIKKKGRLRVHFLGNVIGHPCTGKTIAVK